MSGRAWLFGLFLQVSLSLSVTGISSSGVELSQCCSRGEIHFAQKSTCSKIQKGRSSDLKSLETVPFDYPITSICCLRALLDRTCDYGANMALEDDYCPLSINQIGGGIRKECCECCLLAKDLAGQDCVHATTSGFSVACQRAFFKCCKRQQKANQQKTKSLSRSRTIRFLRQQRQQHRKRCTSADCEQLCKDSDGDSVECSCREGYTLQPDGFSCADINECLLLTDNCLSSERCINTPGSFRCVRTLPCGTGYVLNSDTGQCIDIDECKMGTHFCAPQYQCRNTLGSYRCEMKKCAEREIRDPRSGACTNKFCDPGFTPVNGICQDVDECKDGTHLCGDRPCVNSAGSYKCLCSAGFDFNATTKRCEDINECIEFRGHICSADSFCENTYGSFKCHSIIPET